MNLIEQQLFAQAIEKFERSSEARTLLHNAISWQSKALNTLADKLRPLFAKRNPNEVFTIISFGCGNALELLAIFALTSGLKNIRYIGIDIGTDKLLPPLSSYAAMYKTLVDSTTIMIFEPLDISNKTAMLRLLEKYQLTNQDINAVILRHPCMNVTCQGEPYKEPYKAKGQLLNGNFPDSPQHPSPFRTLVNFILPLMINDQTAIYLSCYRKWEFKKISDIFAKFTPIIKDEHCNAAAGITDQNPATDLATMTILPRETHYVDGYYCVFSPDSRKLQQHQATLTPSLKSPCCFFNRALVTTIAVSLLIAATSNALG